MTDKDIKIGVAGCGAMGLPMALNLLGAGLDVSGFDIRPPDQFGTLSPRMTGSAFELAQECSVVLSVVRDWAQTQDLCFGPTGLFTNGDGPKTLIICSTLSPYMIAEILGRLPPDCSLVDAPMSGAPYRAEDGTLTFMVGGEEAVVDRLMPVFSAMGTEINHLGDVGAGMTCKVLNNMLAATSVVAVREVLAASEKLGFAPDKLLEVAKTSSGGTWFGDNLEKISWADEGYSITNTIGILEKDVKSLLDATENFPELRINEFAEFIIKELRNLAPVTKD